MDLPKISERTNLTLSQAKDEYRELKDIQTNGPEYGWSGSVSNRIYDRLTYLRKIITDFVCKD